jgi:hypothetical protein
MIARQSQSMVRSTLEHCRPAIDLKPLGVLVLAAVLLFGTVSLRGAEYDEQYTLLLVAGTPRPAWPEASFTAGSVREIQAGRSSPAQLIGDLRHTDVHPPLYFLAALAWHDLLGPGLIRLRLLSVVFGLGALAMAGWIAGMTRIPPVWAMGFTLGCYGFAYTAGIARGFALAQFLSLLGVALVLQAERRQLPVIALAAGLALGAATFANYLAVFVAGAALFWLLLAVPRMPRLWLAACLGFAAFVPANLWFFLAQQGTRTGQFASFDLLHSLTLLARFGAGAVFGGLPLYVGGGARLIVSGTIGGLLAALSAIVVWRWRHLADTRRLLAMAAVAPPLGLILLGLAFDNTPVELRYLAFATPFAALLLAGSLATLPRRTALAVGAVVLTVQAVSLAGQYTRPETMQPARATAKAAANAAWPNGVALLPRGNDGVGIVGAFASEAPDWLPMLVIQRGETASQTRIRAGAYRRVVLALLAQDDDSRATAAEMQSAFARQPCWRFAASGFNVLAYDRICGED